MNRSLLAAVLIFTLLCAPAIAAPDPQLGAVEASLEMSFPKVQVERIRATPITGIYELLMPNGEILYFSPQSRHLFFGEIWSSDGHNLTRDSKAELMTAKIDMFPLDKAIKIGNGPNQVIEVVDPDCPFCREGSAFFAGRDDVTRYVFLLPL